MKKILQAIWGILHEDILTTGWQGKKIILEKNMATKRT